MKNILVPALALAIFANCGGRQSSGGENFNKENVVANVEVEKAKPVESAAPKSSSVTAGNSEIRRIDFRNFVYPPGIRVKDGKLDLSEKPTSRQEYEVEDVQYVDLAGDADEEALVDLTTLRGGGSSIYTHGFHLFTPEKGKARLLWQLNTGSEARCGLKEIWTENRKLFLEVFGKCHIENDELSVENYDTDVNTDSFTRFTFGWN
ncbi:MAG: hypothetical protein M3384_09770, partial [Acidobacteriota bacterium]|nr:hypothetical protein [Acidobacteriota bacterium]